MDEKKLIELIDKFLRRELVPDELELLQQLGLTTPIHILQKKYELIDKKLSIKSSEIIEILHKIQNKKIEPKKPFWMNFDFKNFLEKWAFPMFSSIIIFSLIYFNFFKENSKKQNKLNSTADIVVSPTIKYENGVSVKSLFTITSKEDLELTSKNVFLNNEKNFDLEKISTTEYKIKPKNLLNSNDKISVSVKYSEKSFDYVFKSVPTFTISGTTPKDLSKAPTNSTIEIEFNLKNFDFEKAKENFSIEPKVVGKFEKKENKLIFIPEKELNNHFSYKITLKKGVSEEGGQILKEDFVFSFSTKLPENSDGYPNINFPYGLSETSFSTFEQRLNFYDVKNPKPIEVEIYEIDEKNLLENFTFTEKNEKHNSTKLPDFEKLKLVEKIFVEPNTEETTSKKKYGTYDLKYNFSKLGTYAFRTSFEESKQNAFWFVNYTNISSASISDKSGKTLIISANTDGNFLQNSRITIFSLEKNLKSLISGNTNQDGVFEVSKELNKFGNIAKIETQDAKSFVYIKRKEKFYPYYDYDFNSFVSNIKRFPIYYSKENYKFFINKEKPLFSPGENLNLHIFGYKKDDFEFKKIDEKTEINAIFFGPSINFSRQKLAEKKFTLDEFGSRNLSFLIPESTETGFGAIEFFIDSNWVYTENVQIEEHAKQEVEIQIFSNKENFVDEEISNFEISANYFFGKPVENQKLEWNVFNNDYWDYYDSHKTKISSGEIITDTNGKAKFSFPVSFQVNQNYWNYCKWCESYPQNFSIEVVGVLESGQKIIAKKNIKVHPSNFYLKIKSKNYSIKKGEEAEFSIESKNINDEILPNARVAVSIKSYWWEKKEIRQEYDKKTKSTYPIYEWRQGEEDLPIKNFITNKNGNYEFSFKPKKSGSYNLKFKILDKNGKIYRTSNYIYVSDENGEFFNSIENSTISTDKETYEVFDIAKISLKLQNDLKNFGKDYLIVIHQSNIISYKTIRTFGFSKTTLSISENLIPGFSISIFSFNENGDLTSQKKDIKVLRNSKKLNLEIFAKKIFEPNSNESIKIKLTDKNGKGVHGKISLKITEKNLLTIPNDNKDDLFEMFYPETNYFSLLTNYSRNGIYQNFYNDCYYGDCNDNISTLQSTTVSMKDDNTRNPFAWNSSISSLNKSDNENSQNKEGSEFVNSTGFFLVETNENGDGVINFTTPENISSWTISAIGIDKNQRIGISKIEKFITQKDLFIKISLPKFLSRGDTIKVPITIFNYSKNDLDAKIEFTLPEILTISGNGMQEIFLKKESYTTFFVDLFAANSGEAKFSLKIFEKNSENYLEEIEKIISIFPVGRPIIDAKFSEISKNQNFEYNFNYEENFDPNSTNLRITISEDLSPEFVDGLKYINNFPYGYDEQTASKTLLNLEILKNFNLLKEKKLLEIEKSELENFTNAEISKLQSRVHENGEIRLFNNDSDNQFLTLYILQAIGEAKNLGFSVDEIVLQKQVEYAKKILLDEKFDNTIKLFAIYSLTLANENPILEIHEFYKNLDKLNIKELSLLALSMQKSGDKTLAKIVAKKILSNKKIENNSFLYFENPKNNNFNFGENDEFTTALAYLATSQILPNEDENLKILNWISKEKNGDGFWVSTLETSIITRSLISQIINSTFNEEKEFEVILNGKVVSKEKFVNGKMKNENFATLSFGGGNLAKGKNTIKIKSTGKIFANISFKSTKTKFTDEINEIEISKKFFDKNGQEILPKNIKKGDLITIKISAKPKVNIANFLFEDFLPSGFEIINQKNLSKPFTKDELKEYYEDSLYYKHWYQNYQVYKNRIAFFLSNWQKNKELNFEYKARAIFSGEFNSNGTYGKSLYFPEINEWSEVKKVLIK
ncbi:MAG: hypothetical protein Fur0024_4610 [Patescibacteria group bacterium]